MRATATFAAAALMCGVGSPASSQSCSESFRLVGSEPGGAFGEGVSLSDGLAVVGAPGQQAAYFFDPSTGEEIRRLTPSGGGQFDQFGSSVAVSPDAVLVGAPFYDGAEENSGRVFVFDPSTGQELGRIEGSTPLEDDAFGRSIAVHDGLALIGAPNVSNDGRYPGSAYLCDVTNPGSPVELRRLAGSDIEPDEQFGAAVAIGDGIVVVGAYLHDLPGAEEAGAAYVFDLASGAELYKLVSPTASEDDQFGLAVAVGDGVVVVGSYGADPGGIGNAGVAHVFDAATGALLHELTASDAEVGDGFGISVAADGNRAVIGSLREEGSAGAAYLFDLQSGEELAKIVPSNRLGGAQFGRAVSLSGERVLVGAPREALGGGLQGAAYVFECGPRTHLIAMGIDDNGLVRPMRGDLSAEKVAAAFGGLDQIDVTTEVHTYEYDPDNPDDGLETLLDMQAVIDGAVGDGGSIRPGDTAIIYIASHGSFSAPAGGDEVFVCQQVSMFIPGRCELFDTDEVLILGTDGVIWEDDLIRARFDRPEWDEVNKLFIIDACFAGGLWGTTTVGDSGDLATLPKSGIIAASDEAHFSYGEVTTGITYLSLAIEHSLEGLADEESITFDELRGAIMDAEGWLLDTFGDGDSLEGIMLGPYDFTEFYGEVGEATYEPEFRATDDFSFTLGVEPDCAADLDGDGDADADDFFAYLDAFASGDLAVCDIDGDGDCDADDFFAYLDLFATGC